MNIYNNKLAFLILILAFFCASTCLGQAIDSPESLNSKKRIVFLGDSLTEGFGVDPSDNFVTKISSLVSENRLPYEVLNAGVSGDTSAGGLTRLRWLMKSRIDILVISLGANDGLRGLPPEVTEENLNQIIKTAKERYPDIKILLTGMLVPPNMGADYASAFKKVFETISASNQLPLMPFLLQGVAGEPQLNLADGIHPNSRGHDVIANNLWKYLHPLLKN